MATTKYWYSPIYREHNYGFFIEKVSNKYYLGFKYKNGKEISIKLDYNSFKTLKGEWK